MAQVREVVESQIAWVKSKGEINFWYDRWLKGGKLANLVFPPSSVASITIKEFLVNANKYTLCLSILQPNVVSNIRENLQFVSDKPDRCVWMANHNGQFSLPSTWEGRTLLS